MRSLKDFPDRVLLMATTLNGALGLNNGLPWQDKEELKLFKTLTMDCALVAGSVTYAGLPELPGRTVHRLNRNNVIQPTGGIVIGGAKTFASFFTQNCQMVVSIMHGNYHADTYLRQDILAHIRCGIREGVFKPMYDGIGFTTYATKAVASYLKQVQHG